MWGWSGLEEEGMGFYGNTIAAGDSIWVIQQFMLALVILLLRWLLCKGNACRTISWALIVINCLAFPLEMAGTFRKAFVS